MMVKLEGGSGQISVVECLTKHDIPVCAHVGLKPQSVHKIGGFRVQGRDSSAAEQMVKDAIALQDAGADLVLLECVPNEVGKTITQALDVPVIGIGAGPTRRRPDTRAVRHAEYHAGSHATFREEFHGRAGLTVGRSRRLCQAGERRKLSGKGALLLLIECRSVIFATCQGLPLSRLLTARSTSAMREYVSTWRDAEESIALVPTMGNLHAGHLSLIAFRRHAG